MTRWCSQIRNPFVACNIPAPSTRTQRDSNQNTIWKGSPADAKPLLQGVWDAGAPLSCLCHLCASPLRSPALRGLLVFFFSCCGSVAPAGMLVFGSLFISPTWRQVQGCCQNKYSSDTVYLSLSLYIYKYIWQDGEIKQHQAQDGWKGLRCYW